jgi:hypothetical protein
MFKYNKTRIETALKEEADRPQDRGVNKRMYLYHSYMILSSLITTRRSSS